MSFQSRHVYTRNERIILEASFACRSHPDITEKERLAKLLNCNIIQISNWFQNHRVNKIQIFIYNHFYLLFFSVELKKNKNLSYQTLQQLPIQSPLFLLPIKQLIFIIKRIVHSIIHRIITIHLQLNMPMHTSHTTRLLIHMLLMNNKL
jgi:hypothetical protein